MLDDSFALTDEYDHMILMHRNAHFSGSFSIMQEYYKTEGKGTMPEIEPPRIRALAALEKQDPTIFEDFLSPAENEEVNRARMLYQTLRQTYEEEAAAPIAKAIADLLLTENEEPQAEIDALVALGHDAVDPLIALINNDDFYNPLFPGYGFAPAAAMAALGKIGDAKAIAPLFQAMKSGDFFMESAVIDALKEIGPQAKTFLLQRLKQRPFTEENTRAAIALASFNEDPDVIAANLAVLEETALDNKYLELSKYLLLNCLNTKSSTERSKIEALAKHPSLRELLE